MDNKYLEKIALNRLTKELLRPKTGVSLDRVSQFLRPKSAFEDGLFNAGVKRVHSAGGTFTSVTKNSPMPEVLRAYQGGGHITNMNPWTTSPTPMVTSRAHDTLASRLISPLHKVLEAPGTTKAIDAIGVNHEAFEAHSMTRAMKRFFKEGGRIPAASGIVSTSPLKVTGKHMDLGVLARESNLINGVRKSVKTVPYPEVRDALAKSYQKAGERFKALRTGTGESEVLKKYTSKPYGSNFSKRDISTLEQATPDTHSIAGLSHSPRSPEKVKELNKKYEDILAGGHSPLMASLKLWNA